MRGGLPAVLSLVAVCPLSAAPAQDLAGRMGWVGGLEYRSLSFQRPAGAVTIRQMTLPLGIELTRGRLALDAGTSLASTRLTRRDGADYTVSNLTDTQVRASYVFGRDAVVATLVTNLPTGPEAASAQDYAVLGTVSPAFLAFPTPVYASGFSMVGGIATAIEVGEWSIGLAGSVKLSDQFTPYRDASGPITYDPGIEGRVRVGADGLIGSSQLTLALALSTFGTDQLGAGGVAMGEYRPGTRLITEGSFLAPVGSSSLNLSVWNFHRAAGDTSSVSAENQENLVGAAVSLLVPARPSISLETRLEGRLFHPRSGSGHWLGGGLGLRIDVARGIGIHPGVRHDRGSVTDEAGQTTSITGWQFSVFIRVQY